MIFIYEDGNQGASEECVSWTKDGIHRALRWLESEELLTRPYSVGVISAERIKQDPTWRKECSLLIFPGGRDMPYCLLLNGQGNTEIKEYVRSGGSYLGICAGAYYGCEYVEFEKTDPILSVCGPRELGFFKGTGRGSYYPGFNYQNRSGTRPAPIVLEPAAQSHLGAQCVHEDLIGSRIYSYFNGGCEFVPNGEFPEDSVSMDAQRLSTNIMARYAEMPRESGCGAESSNAIVMCEFGLGRVVLTGVHLEVDVEELAKLQDPLLQRVVNKLVTTNSQRRILFALIVKFLLG